MQRSKMHSVSIFLLLQGVVVCGEDEAARGADLLKMKVSSLTGPHTPVSKTPRLQGPGQLGSIRPDRLHSVPHRCVQNLLSL